ncbi:TetR/AcrR family transcriptional regulator [Bowmanella yangjiangensis]|uniref:TetR/AcrR family transcriptional regulator n=1 Tax=Bowmanella yangjiangensis TaxID=2811230 RepID=A0ABS3CSS6_9ALTE|nr:TetR/AcrR family transcriptional regulator [Bowmanella yangjiangensis]MBN7820178.1 TetR/AcrR family transcriptional regulator [Bowmanella yangjiangensis]
MLKCPAFAQFISVPEPAQQRSRDALERMLAAGEQLLAKNAFENASVAQIAEQGSSSVGTFYRVLQDKDTLSQLLIQRFFQSTIATMDRLTRPEDWQNKPLHQFIFALSECLVGLTKGRQGVLRALILRASKDTDFRDRVHQLNEHLASRVVGVLKLHTQEVQHPEPAKAMQICIHFLIGALNQHTVTGNLPQISQEEMIQEFAEIILAYLRVTSRASHTEN